MFCPKCKSEYREGFTQCSNCNTDLVEEINEDYIKESKSKEPKIKSLSKILDINIEKCLKIGSIYYVIISIISALLSFIVKLFFPTDLLTKFDINLFLSGLLTFVNSVLTSAGWGLFLFAFGKVVEILKEGNKND